MSLLPPEERRWATVLFADLTGFTALSEEMDPEDVKGMVDECSRLIGIEVDRFGGSMLRLIGDAALVVFGAPVAHEDDPERAVRAALAMRAAVSGMSVGDQPLTLHIGINTGEVIAGAVGPAELHEYSVMGDVANTAARLMSAAPGGSIFVGTETYLATRRVVRYREVGAIVAKGKAKPVEAWEAMSIEPVPQVRPLGKTGLVGRDDEMGLLSRLWDEALKRKRSRVVTIVGEPGVGKSRLTAEFGRTRMGDATVLQGRCLPYGEGLGYWALAMVVRGAAGAGPDDPAPVARRALGELSQTLGLDVDVAARVALLTGLADTDDERFTADQPTLHAAVAALLAGLSHRKPLCVILDDLHWADEALLDLIEFIAAQAQDAPLLVLAATRPDLLERRPAWGQGQGHHALVLEPLDEDSADALVASLCAEHGVPSDRVTAVSRHVEGNPLFAEEWVAMLSESEASEEMPSSVRTLIASRLDLLASDERSTMQLAAVFGTIFWDRAVEDLAVGDVGPLLASLGKRNLVRASDQSKFPDSVQFEFKHALIRDVAYEMLPRAKRRTLHERAAQWIEETGGDRLDQLLDLLVYHFTQADHVERAIEYLTKAADRARRAAAHRDEAALLGQAIELAQGGEGELESTLRAARGRALGGVGVWNEARAEMEQALLGLPSGEHEERARVLVDLAGYCHWLFDVPATKEHARAALALAEEAGREDLVAAALATLALADSSDGNLDESLNKHQRAFALAGSSNPLLVRAIELDSLILYWTGHFEGAVSQGSKAVELARSAGDTPTTVRALSDLGLALTGAGRYDEALMNFEEARRFATAHGVETWLGRSVAMEGGLHLDLFDFARAEELAQEAREIGLASRFRLPVVSGGIDLLLNHARRGEPGRAAALVDELRQEVEEARGAHGWLWRLRFAAALAELAVVREDVDQARLWAETAIDQGRLSGRIKYQVTGLEARARASVLHGEIEDALRDGREAMRLANGTGAPMMWLRPAVLVLSLDGNDELAEEVRTKIDGVVESLTDEKLRERFISAETISGAPKS